MRHRIRRLVEMFGPGNGKHRRTPSHCPPRLATIEFPPPLPPVMGGRPRPAAVVDSPLVRPWAPAPRRRRLVVVGR
ncbi:hypothetical protein [Streptomyces carminius]|uniref:hypothetical protein n=1 Tax=Streptomyces carminius TaxID=2665496 RepID=UPI0011B4E28F|nr:hypothetical protein [Streptomyces carminius]